MRSAGIVSLAVFSSRITGLIREIVFAAMFGAGQIFDAFRIGFLIPNLARDLFAEGALSSAFVPIFTQYLSTRGKEEAARLANLVASAIVVVVGTGCVLGILFSPQMVTLVAPGFRDVSGKYELAVAMTRIMMPFLLLVALAAQGMGILNACNQFGVPALASTSFNLGSLAFGLLLGRGLGPKFGISPIYGMAYGVVIGGAIQLAWQMPSLYRAGFRFRPAFDWAHPGLQHILRLMGPAIIGNAAVQINVTVNNNFASWLGDGAVSWLNYAFRFVQLPLGVFGVAIAAATLPAISRKAAEEDIQGFRETLSRSLGLVFLLTVPSAVGLAVMGQSIVAAIYQFGAFKAFDTEQTARALACYAIGLAGYSAAKVLTPAFYALNDSRTPVIVSFSSVLINIAAVTYLVRFSHLGHEGLALSTSGVAVFSSLALFWVMRNRIGGIYGRNLWRSFIRVLAASIVMGAVAYLSSRAILGAYGVSKASHVLNLGISIPLAMVTLYASCRALQVPELDMAMASLAGPLARLRGKMADQ